MSTATTWLIIIGLAAGTYLLRLSFIQAWQWIDVPPALARALRYVPPAVFAALVLPALTVSGGVIDVSPGNERLVAGVLAAAVAWYTRSVILTLCAGMGALWLLQAVS